MLSQNDRRLLAEIESAMASEDPALEARLRTGHVPAFAWVEDHALMIGLIMWVSGATAMVAFLTVSISVSMAGVFTMIAASLLLGRPLVRLHTRLLRHVKSKKT